jgi:hypothetical protein
MGVWYLQKVMLGPRLPWGCLMVCLSIGLQAGLQLWVESGDG